MTGQEFKRIREFNKISQLQMAYNLGYSTRTPVIQAEQMEYLPYKYPKVISELIGLDFTDDNKVEEYLTKLPVKEPRKRVKRKQPIVDIFKLKSKQGIFNLV